MTKLGYLFQSLEMDKVKYVEFPVIDKMFDALGAIQNEASIGKIIIQNDIIPPTVSINALSSYSCAYIIASDIAYCGYFKLSKEDMANIISNGIFRDDKYYDIERDSLFSKGVIKGGKNIDEN